MKNNFYLILVFALLLLTSCTSSAQAQTSSSTNGLQITDMKVSVGAAAENTGTQLVSYDVTIYNTNPSTIVLDWLEPVLEDSTSSRVTDQNLRVKVGQTITPNTGLVITGSFKIDTSGLTKADMENWQYIYSIKFASEEVIPVPLGGSTP